MSNNTPRRATVALMGPTGTGKSTFIKLLSNDDKIRIGHSIESETIDVSTTSYSEAGRVVTLVDTPGFDDSREGVTDTDILEKIAKALQEGEGRKLDGIIYLHRISDPRVGGTIKKNIRMFRELCGDENLHRVRIVTTNWNRVTEKEGNDREAALRNSVFKPFIDAGAEMLRHDKERSSARSIMSTVLNGKQPVMLKIQKELNEGKALRETSAGAVIIEEMIEMEKKHNKEMKVLREEMEEATRENNEELRSELAAERRKLEGLRARAEADKRKLERTRLASQARPSLPADKVVIPEPQLASSTQGATSSRYQDQAKETVKSAERRQDDKKTYIKVPTVLPNSSFLSNGSPSAMENSFAKSGKSQLAAEEEGRKQKQRTPKLVTNRSTSKVKKRTPLRPDGEPPVLPDGQSLHVKQPNRRGGAQMAEIRFISGVILTFVVGAFSFVFCMKFFRG